mmetsp:Transcript_58580/g.155660  ORF Transcript_58580/g.155660 Transcript_58580/m.155660 type:complete len:403 (-) Transcript_58580:57-1265(-)
MRALVASCCWVRPQCTATFSSCAPWTAPRPITKAQTSAASTRLSPGTRQRSPHSRAPNSSARRTTTPSTTCPTSRSCCSRYASRLRRSLRVGRNSTRCCRPSISLAAGPTMASWRDARTRRRSPTAARVTCVQATHRRAAGNHTNAHCMLMTPDLGRRIFHTREVLAFLKSARARVWDVEAPVTAQWMCEYEDATLGWAVWKAAAGESSTVRPSFVALAHGLRAMQQNAIIDVQDLCNTGGSIHVSDHLTVHKLEIDDAALQRRVDAEVDQNTHVFARLHVPPQYFVQEIANCNRRARPFLDAEAAAFSSLNVSARRSRQWVVDCRGPLQMGTFLDSGVAARPYEPSEEFSSLRFATHHGGTRREAADFFGGVARSAPWRYCTAVIQEREGGRGRVVEGEPS